MFTKGRTRLDAEQTEILEALKEKFNWAGHIYSLKNRLIKIMDNTKISAREGRELKRLLRKEHTGEMTLLEILELFPGKTMKQIKEFKKKYEEEVDLSE